MIKWCEITPQCHCIMVVDLILHVLAIVQHMQANSLCVNYVISIPLHALQPLVGPIWKEGRQDKVCVTPFYYIQSW